MKKLAIFAFLATLILSTFCIIGLADEGGYEPVKAYRELVFGETKNDTNQKVMKDKALQGNVWACFTKINNQQYGVKFLFKDDIFYQIIFTSNYIFSPRVYSASYYDTKLLPEIETLRAVIEAQYGPPHFVQDVPLYATREEQINFKYAWVIDEMKEIKIGIACGDYKYWAELWIGYVPILQELKEAENAEAEKNIQESSGDF